jgi:hypothetical protein
MRRIRNSGRMGRKKRRKTKKKRKRMHRIELVCWTIQRAEELQRRLRVVMMI